MPYLRAVLGQPLDPEAVVLVRAFDRHAKLFGEDAGRAAMVDMAVGQQDLLDRDAGLRRRRLEPRQIAAGIDEGAAHRRRAPQQGAILLQRRHRDDRRAQRRARSFGPAAREQVASAGGSSFIDAATASARRMHAQDVAAGELGEVRRRSSRGGSARRTESDSPSTPLKPVGRRRSMPSRSPPIPTWSWPAILATCSIWSATSRDGHGRCRVRGLPGRQRRLARSGGR